jgi:hypothetical protein
MIRRLLLGSVALGLAVAVVLPASTAGARTSGRSSAGYNYWRSHGYLVSNPARYAQLKAQAAARAGQRVSPNATSPRDPVANVTFAGVSEADLAPPDTTGAIGLNSYVEMINLQIALYSRTGTPMAAVPMEALFGGTHFNYSDPQAIWDPHTNRFYLLIWDTTNATFRWAFSKTAAPATLTAADWCVYTSTFGYSPNDAPDYPKLGQTSDFLLIGVNFFQNFQIFKGGDLLTIQKPQGSGPIGTCPPNTYATHRFAGLKNVNGTLTNAPEPAKQADPGHTGYIVTTGDLTGDSGPTSNFITIFDVKFDPNNPAVPILSAPRQVTVPTFSVPPPAPQQGTSKTLDTLDGRLENAVWAGDTTGVAHVYTSFAVAGGAGSEQRWFELNTGPVPSIQQSGVINDPTLYVFNGDIATDRKVTTATAYGNNEVISVSTSSASNFPAFQMVSKVGANPQSGLVVVQQSTVSDQDFSCNPTCRWGDYSGASPDPGTPFGQSSGMVWLANQYLSGPNPGGLPNWKTWIAGVTP